MGRAGKALKDLLQFLPESDPEPGRRAGSGAGGRGGVLSPESGESSDGGKGGAGETLPTAFAQKLRLDFYLCLSHLCITRVAGGGASRCRQEQLQPLPQPQLCLRAVSAGPWWTGLDHEDLSLMSLFWCFLRDCNVQGLVKGQGEEPVWSELSPDSACSDGSTESTDQPQDPGLDRTLI